MNLSTLDKLGTVQVMIDTSNSFSLLHNTLPAAPANHATYHPLNSSLLIKHPLKGTKISVKRPRPGGVTTMEELREAFALFDRDNNGSIDASELQGCFRALGFEVDPAELDQMLQSIDADSNSTIELPEFVAMMIGAIDGSQIDLLTIAQVKLVR